jgi:hypothetical protein
MIILFGLSKNTMEFHPLDTDIVKIEDPISKTNTLKKLNSQSTRKL